MNPDQSRTVSEKLCDNVCLTFALWTLCCHLAVALDGNLRQLIFFFTIVGGSLLFVRWRAQRSSPAAEIRLPVVTESSRAWPGGRWVRALGLGAAFFAVLKTGTMDVAVPLWFWWVGITALAAAFFVLPEPATWRPPLRGRAAEWALWSLALACVCLTLATHRPDADDGFYVNLAVAAVDHPEQRLLHEDTLHGIEGLPIHLPIYRLHSWELWNAAISYLTGIPAMTVFHLLSAALAALMVPLVYARLLRLLTPRIWPWAVLAVLVVLVGAGDVHRWYGNFALVRIWQGKGIYLFVFMPLVYAYGIAFALRPSWRRWLLLLAAQVSALGASSSAVWAAPVGALMALCCVLRPKPRDLALLLAGGLTVVYLLSAGGASKGGMQDLEKFVEEIVSPPGLRLRAGLYEVLGIGGLRFFGLLSLLGAWALCPRGLARRFAIVFPLATGLILLNPFIDGWVAAQLSGPAYWRVLWSVPLPLLMALVLVSPLHLPLRPELRGAVCIALMAAFLALVPSYSSVSAENGARLGWPGLKVPEEHHSMAAMLNERFGPKGRVVAPPGVRTWMPTFHGHAYPVVVQPVYLARFKQRLGLDNVRARILMSHLAGGGEPRDPDDGKVFLEGLDRFAIDGVCLRRSRQVRPLRRLLRSKGFALEAREGRYEIWGRGDGLLPAGRS